MQMLAKGMFVNFRKRKDAVMQLQMELVEFLNDGELALAEKLGGG